MCSHSDSQGFTLIEVLVAIIILAVGLVLVAQVMARTQQAMGISRNLLSASMIAEERVREAELRLREYHKLSSSSEQGDEQVLARKYHWSLEVRPFHHASIEDQTRINQVITEVRWKEAGREDHLQLPFVAMNREGMEA